MRQTKTRDQTLPIVGMICLDLLAVNACGEESTEPEPFMNLDPPSELQASRIPGMVAVRLSWKDNAEVGFANEYRQNNGTSHDDVDAVDALLLKLTDARS